MYIVVDASHSANHSAIAANGAVSTNSALFFIVLHTDNNSVMGQIKVCYGANNGADCYTIIIFH